MLRYICISECLYYTTHGTVSILQKSHNTNILKEPYCPYWRKIKCIDRRLGIKNPCLLHYRREKRSKIITGLSPAFCIPSCQEIWQGAQTAFQAKRNLAQLEQKKPVWTQTNYKRKGNKQLHYLAYYQYAFLSCSLFNYI